jgi:2-keto-4-pentenoate hydratase/2-oxohepta-3-ene-1,7-dioic acid hydratase in catechol pathway
MSAITWNGLFERTSPGKIVCVGLNYFDHATETSMEVPTEPLLFGKFGNCLIGAGETIVLPSTSEHVDAEAELALVIGRRASKVSRDDALEHVAGYTVANDVSARDLQFRDGQWFRGKGHDTFCPVLEHLVPTAELGAADDVRVVQRLNGEVLQDGRTSSLIFDVPSLVAYISSVLTLEVGDLILTGTPPGVGYFREPKVALSPGDIVEVEIEGIGVLANPVAAQSGGRFASRRPLRGHA